MRRSILTVLVLTSTIAFASNRSETATGAKQTPLNASSTSDQPVVLPCDWQTGATYHYTYAHQKAQTGKPAEFGEVWSTYPLKITVTKAGNPASFSYDRGPVTYEGPSAVVDAMNSMMVPPDQLPLSLIFKDGFVTEVTNATELVDAMEEMNIPGMKETMAKTVSMFRDPVFAQQMLLQEPRMFFSMHCAGLYPKEKIVGVTQHPNPFGGPPIQGESTIEWVSHDTETNTLTMRTKDQMDPESLKQALAYIFQTRTPGADNDVNTLPPIEKVLTGHLVYSTADGHPMKVEFHQEIGSSEHPEHVSETWTWVRVPASSE